MDIQRTLHLSMQMGGTNVQTTNLLVIEQLYLPDGATPFGANVNLKKIKTTIFWPIKQGQRPIGSFSILTVGWPNHIS